MTGRTQSVSEAVRGSDFNATLTSGLASASLFSLFFPSIISEPDLIFRRNPRSRPPGRAKEQQNARSFSLFSCTKTVMYCRKSHYSDQHLQRV
jgi:hypothetical protein